ncbi:MAG: hypothetical protein ACK4L7_10175, partial [Flavobacteriales bacterium]
MSARPLLSLLLALWAVALRAQQDPLVEALRKYQSGDLAGARALVDEAVASERHAANAEAWLLRGYVYKDVFKAKSGTKEGDAARDTARASLERSLALDAYSTYRENALQAHEFLARSCYNDAAKALAEGNDQRAVLLFDAYRDGVLRLNPR